MISDAVEQVKTAIQFVSDSPSIRHSYPPGTAAVRQRPNRQRANQGAPERPWQNSTGMPRQEPAPTEIGQVARSLYSAAAEMCAVGRYHDALDLYNQLLRRFRRSRNGYVQEVVTSALLDSAWTLIQLDRLNEALVTNDQVLRRYRGWFPDDPGHPVRAEDARRIAGALLNKGDVLARLGRHEAALRVFNFLLSPRGYRPSIARYVAMALVNKGRMLESLNRVEKALSVYQRS